VTRRCDRACSPVTQCGDALIHVSPIAHHSTTDLQPRPSGGPLHVHHQHIGSRPTPHQPGAPTDHSAAACTPAPALHLVAIDDAHLAIELAAIAHHQHGRRPDEVAQPRVLPAAPAPHRLHLLARTHPALPAHQDLHRVLCVTCPPRGEAARTHRLKVPTRDRVAPPHALDQLT